jgi:hypothetical protein
MYDVPFQLITETHYLVTCTLSLTARNNIMVKRIIPLAMKHLIPFQTESYTVTTLNESMKWSTLGLLIGLRRNNARYLNLSK